MRLGTFITNADIALTSAVRIKAQQYFLLEQLSTFFGFLGDN
jgi:hypothetical protein